MVTMATSKPASEFNQFVIYEHGKDEHLLWWKVSNIIFNLNWHSSPLLQVHQHEFLIIEHMAHDFLAIPGAMVSVEWLFSKSQHLCTDQWSSL